MRSYKVSGMIEEVYSEACLLEKRGRFRKHKGSDSWVWGKNEGGSNITGEVRHSWRERL